MSLPHERREITPGVQVAHLPNCSEEPFFDNVAAACRLLRSMHLRLSVFVVRPVGMSTRAAAARLTGALGAYGLIGTLPHGRVGFLHLDRCRVSDRGDEAVGTFVRGRVDDALGTGWTRRLTALHYWTDEMPDPDDLLTWLDEEAGAGTFELVATSAGGR